MACALWGREWAGCTVLAQCDNEAVVADINGGITKKMTLCIYFDVSFSSLPLQNTCKAYILSKNNQLADALSRNNLCLFQELRPTVAQPKPIPHS